MATDNIVIQFVTATPPITRVLVALTIVISVSTFLNFIKPQQLSYSRFYLREWQLHRIFTTFFYYGKTNFELIMNFIFLYKYSSMLEESYGKKSDYFFVLLIVFIILFVTSNVVYIPFLATALSNTITYIWTRKNPQGIVQIFGFVSFNAFYLPFIFPMVSLVFEGRVSKDEILGIVVGQIVFYLKDVYPKFGRDWLKTPCWCHGLFSEKGPCCESKHLGQAMRKKVSDFCRIKQQKAALEEDSDWIVPEKSTTDDDRRNDEKNGDIGQSNSDAGCQDARDDGQCFDASSNGEFDSYPIHEEGCSLDSDIVNVVDGGESRTEDDKSLYGESGKSESILHENQQFQNHNLESCMQQAVLPDSVSRFLDNNPSEVEDQIEQGNEESFNSEEICDGFDDTSGTINAKNQINEQNPGESTSSMDTNAKPDGSSSHGENSWDSE